MVHVQPGKYSCRILRIALRHQLYDIIYRPFLCGPVDPGAIIEIDSSDAHDDFMS